MTRRIISILLWLIAGSLFAGCANENWVPIGYYSPQRIGDKEIDEILGPARIPWTSEGSIGYQLSVPGRYADRAKMLLRQSKWAPYLNLK
jgi:hypothetical protein